MTSVRVAIAQINLGVGNLAGNAARILDASRDAAKLGAQVVLTPELSMTGYPPEDLLLRPSFIEQCDEVLAKLCSDLSEYKGLHVIVGHPVKQSDGLYNAASILCDGKIVGTYLKHDLPNYSVFDEKRYFKSGNQPLTFDINGVRLGLIVCEDAWFETAPMASAKQGAKVILSPNEIGRASCRERVSSPV